MYTCHRQAGLASPAFSFVLAITLTLLLFYSNNAHGTRLPVTELVIGNRTIHAEVAANTRSRNQGLMHRQSLPADTGMLFVFDRTGRPCFWMKNTPLPLSIAFIDESGAIVNIADMTPNSLESHCPEAPIRYALEMEQGWFADNGIQSGAQVHHLPPASIAQP